MLTLQKDASGVKITQDVVLGEYLAFEVYDKNGVMLSRVPFPERVARFDNMTMHGNHLFFIDPFEEACIYEYAVVD